MSRRKTTPIDQRIRALSDKDLGALITELGLSVPLYQSMLAESRREKRRRTRRAAKEAASK